MKAPFQSYSLTIEILSPVHIGSGESVDPYSFTLRNNNNHHWLIALDLPKLYSSLNGSQRARYYELLDRADIPQLREWVDRHANSDHYLFAVQIPELILYNELKESIANPERKVEVELFTRRPDNGMPYIPGSSIKGAIRTALVDYWLDDQQNNRRLLSLVNDPRPNGQIFEAHALGYFKNNRIDLYHDPFRQLAISDASLPDDACYIDSVKIIRKLNSTRGTAPDPRGIKMYRDMTWSAMEGETIQTQTQCRLFQPEVKQQCNLPQAIDIKTICQACNTYYQPEIERQMQEYTPRDEYHVWKPLLQASSDLAENQCVIRVGRHSHYECVVLSKPFNRRPHKGAGATRSYAHGRLPFGWMRLTFTPDSHHR
ncbi:MAG: type III-A CRISPR-associated RAMP protein Csm5 [Gammaproteobacteria bacterium]|nr:MAG: type III-A CRISPR-associated RAMP protein Csm5 [Gammaproteobacteria bacterium]